MAQRNCLLLLALAAALQVASAQVQGPCQLIDASGNVLTVTYGLCTDCFAGCDKVAGCDYVAWNSGAAVPKSAKVPTCSAATPTPEPTGKQADCILKDVAGNELAKTSGLCPDCHLACSVTADCQSVTWDGKVAMPKQEAVDAMCGTPTPPTPSPEAPVQSPRPVNSPQPAASCTLAAADGTILASTWGRCRDCLAACNVTQGCVSMTWDGVTTLDPVDVGAGVLCYGMPRPSPRITPSPNWMTRDASCVLTAADGAVLNNTVARCRLCYNTCNQTLGCTTMVWDGVTITNVLDISPAVICEGAPAPSPRLSPSPSSPRIAPSPNWMHREASCVLLAVDGSTLGATTDRCKDCYAACNTTQGCVGMTWDGVTIINPLEQSVSMICEGKPDPSPNPFSREASCELMAVDGTLLNSTFTRCRVCYNTCNATVGCTSMTWDGVTTVSPLDRSGPVVCGEVPAPSPKLPPSPVMAPSPKLAPSPDPRLRDGNCWLYADEGLPLATSYGKCAQCFNACNATQDCSIMIWDGELTVQPQDLGVDTVCWGREEETPQCKAGVPMCRLYVHDMVCCNNTDIVTSKTYAVTTLACTEEVEVMPSVACYNVTGPPGNDTKLRWHEFSGNVVAGSTLMIDFAPNMTANPDATPYFGNVTVDIDMTTFPGICHLKLKQPCKVNGTEYTSIQDVQHISFQVFDSTGRFYNQLTAPSQLAYLDSLSWLDWTKPGHCVMQTANNLPPAFFSNQWRNYRSGIKATCSSQEGETCLVA